MTIRTHGQHWTRQIKLEDLHVGRRIRLYIGNFRQPLLQKLNGTVVIHTVIELRLQVNAPIWICRKILDCVRENLVVANDRLNVVRRIKDRDKQPDLPNGARHAPGGYEVAHFNRPENNHESPGRKIGKQPAPGQTNGDAGRSEQGSKSRGLNTEVTKNRNDQNDIQSDRYDRAQVA